MENNNQTIPAEAGRFYLLTIDKDDNSFNLHPIIAHGFIDEYGASKDVYELNHYYNGDQGQHHTMEVSEVPYDHYFHFDAGLWKLEGNDVVQTLVGSIEGGDEDDFDKIFNALADATRCYWRDSESFPAGYKKYFPIGVKSHIRHYLAVRKAIKEAV